MFRFIEITEGPVCPHCGAEGRWIYHWEDSNGVHSAMAGCYKALTGWINKGEDARFFEHLAEKQAKGKALNGWDKNVLRLLSFKKDNKYPDEWIDRKIHEVLRDKKQWMAEHHFAR